MKTVLVILLVGAGAFCLRELTSTFTPADQESQTVRRVVYGAGLLACAVLVGLRLAATIRADSRESR